MEKIFPGARWMLREARPRARGRSQQGDAATVAAGEPPLRSMGYASTVTAAMTADSWTLTAGAEIDPSLVVIEALGGGTRYEVYRAWDRQLFCQVAVKMIRPHRAGEDRVIDEFRHEIEISSGLQHPNLVRLLR